MSRGKGPGRYFGKPGNKKVVTDIIDKREMSKCMQRQELLRKKEEESALEQMENADEGDLDNKVPSVALAKTTKLVFFRQYNTYQALLAVHPRGDLPVDTIYAKVILYIMRWFRGRLGQEHRAAMPEIGFLWEVYPEPEDVDQFKIDEAGDINGFDFIDFETAFLKKRTAWVVRLVEPDNGQERTDIQGRTFTTEICVYRQEGSVVLGIREACREPESNTEDAFGYRPGFVRDIFYDPDLLVTEQGIDTEYAFSNVSYRLNGKAGEACERLYKRLITADGRQMPVLFVPGDFYEAHKEEVDQKTGSLLGYCHVIVWENTCRKLFEQVMENDELVEAAEAGKLIFYRTCNSQEYPTSFFDPDAEGVMDEVKFVAQHEPLRKFCDFGEFSFKPSWQEVMDRGEAGEELENLQRRFDAEKAESLRMIHDLERDNSHLQSQLRDFEDKNKKLNKEVAKNASEIAKVTDQAASAIEACNNAKAEMESLRRENEQIRQNAKRELGDIKGKYKPLLNLPPLTREKKEEILNWIRESYGDVLVIHPRGEKAFFDDERNLDWHRLCMMIHYLAGYTRHRNEGGIAFDPEAARDYDVEDAAYKVDPTSSGQGAMEMHKDKYTITITEKGEAKEVLLDLHLKYGKGMDDNMIRIYFHYSAPEKKTFIGYMPGHLPLR